MMENNKKYFLAEKEKWVKHCIIYKEEYDNQQKGEKESGKKKKVWALIQRILLRRSQERFIYPSLRNKPAKQITKLKGS